VSGANKAFGLWLFALSLWPLALGLVIVPKLQRSRSLGSCSHPNTRNPRVLGAPARKLKRTLARGRASRDGMLLGKGPELYRG
jgi:hypothetical protein